MRARDSRTKGNVAGGNVASELIGDTRPKGRFQCADVWVFRVFLRWWGPETFGEPVSPEMPIVENGATIITESFIGIGKGIFQIFLFIGFILGKEVGHSKKNKQNNQKVQLGGLSLNIR